MLSNPVPASRASAVSAMIDTILSSHTQGSECRLNAAFPDALRARSVRFQRHAERVTESCIPSGNPSPPSLNALYFGRLESTLRFFGRVFPANAIFTAASAESTGGIPSTATA